MNLSAPFIHRPVMTTLLMLCLTFFGIWSYIILPMSDLPSIEYPTIEVDVSFPGASPETMAMTVAAPLEREFATIDGVETISSTSLNGQTTIVLQFGLKKNLDTAASDTQARITESLSYLPANLPNQPTYQKVNPTASPIMYYAFTSDTLSTAEIYDYVDGYISRRISMLEGVSSVPIYGSPYAVRVQVDPSLLHARKVNINDVANTIVAANVELPLGTLYGNKREFTIFADGEIYDAKGYASLVVRNQDGDLVRISDLGRAIDGLQNDKTAIDFFKDGKMVNCVAIGIQKMGGANTLKVIESIKKLMPEATKLIPSSIKVEEIIDQSHWINESIKDVQLTLFFAFLLVAVVTFLYLGKFMESLIPIIVIPIAILGSFCFMFFMGYTLDILSLLAITLSIGFLVDDAIVVLENTVRHLEQGKTKLQAALDGSKQISITVLSMTVSLAAVFIPMLFMKGMVGRLFTEFAVVIIATIAISGVISLTLSPLLCSRFLVPHHLKSKSFLEKFSEKINALFLNTYLSFLNMIMERKLSTLCFGLVALVLTGALTFAVPKDFIPPDDLGIVEGFLKMEDGTSPFETIRVQQQIGKILQKNDCCDSIVTVGAAPTSNQGAFYINLKPRSQRESIFDLIPKFYEQLSSIPGVQIFMKPYPLFELSIGTSASLGAYQYTLQSFNTEKLYKTAEIFMEKIKSVPGVSQVTSDMFNKEPQVNILIDRDKAYNFNISANDIELAIGYAYGGTKISQINGAIDQYDVVLETIPEAYKDPYMMSKLYVSDAQVPLSNLAKITEGIGPLMVNHLNTLPSVTITFEVEKGTPLGEALGKIQTLASQVLPTDVIGEVQGTAKVFQETFRSLVPLVIITLFIIYVILGILYENFVHPITVMSVLPPTAMGGLLTLFVCQEAISLYSFVGIMMLLGIVLKNGIILIDFAIEEMEKNKLSPQEAMISACKIRFRPILMTTIAALMGAVPIAIGYGGSLAEARRPLGIAIVGGLIFSQLLTLFLTPVIFIYLERVRAFFKKG